MRPDIYVMKPDICALPFSSSNVFEINSAPWEIPKTVLKHMRWYEKIFPGVKFQHERN